MASSSPFDGTNFLTGAPDQDQPHGNDYKEHQSTRKSMEFINNKQHKAIANDPSAVGGGGEHADITTDSIVNAGTLDSAGDFSVNGKFDVDAGTGQVLCDGGVDIVGTLDPTTFTQSRGGFKDEDDMASDSPVVVASQQSIKAYTDNSIAASIPFGLDGANESSGEVSIGELELKYGQVTLTSSPQTHTFTALTGIDSAFARCFQVIACPGGPDAGTGGSGTRIYDITGTTFKTSSENFNSDTPLRFIAIGR